MIASFSRIGSVPRSWAMVGNAVAMTVESTFSMSNAEATISAVSCGRFKVGSEMA